MVDVVMCLSYHYSRQLLNYSLGYTVIDNFEIVSCWSFHSLSLTELKECLSLIDGLHSKDPKLFGSV